MIFPVDEVVQAVLYYKSGREIAVGTHKIEFEKILSVLIITKKVLDENQSSVIE